MRLIAGVLYLDGRAADAGLLKAMGAQMIAPGLQPRTRVWCDGTIGLSVLDFSARGSADTVMPERGDWIAAADVRLDAPASLARELVLDTTDADHLLLAALQRWDTDAPDKVLGDFAFAAWNRSTRTLSCGRDIFGIRPLVYMHVPGQLFAFASLPRALHGAGLIDKKLDPCAVGRRLAFAWNDRDTLFEGISQLPPAHVLTVNANGLSVRRYWRLVQANAGTRRIAPDAAARELRMLFEEAVRCRLPAEGPVGAHLSGGLDSSAISILAVRMLREQRRKLFAYSFLPRAVDDALKHEKPYVDAVRAQEPDIVWKPIHEPDICRALPPRMDTDHILSIEPDNLENATCAAAAARGVELLLNGYGGDEGPTFNARGGLAEALWRGKWRYLLSEVAAIKRTRGRRISQIWRGEILQYLIPNRLLAIYGRLRHRPVSMELRFRPALKPELRARLGNIDEQIIRMGGDARVNQFRLLSSPHISYRADKWAAIGARYGIAFAFPMLDRRVAEFALSLPSDLFLRGGFGRRVFRDAMAGVLPELIRWRRDKLTVGTDTIKAAAAMVEPIARRLAEASAKPDVAAVFDFNYLRQSLAAFPTAEALRNGADDSPIVVVLAALHFGAYVEAAHDQPGTPSHAH